MTEQNLKVAIYGYGVEGRSTAQFLGQHFAGMPLSIYDDQSDEEEVIRASNAVDWSSYDLIFVSPGINRKEKLPESVWAKCTSQIEYFFQLLPEHKRRHVIGITGSKGKSSTTKFCTEFLVHAGYRAEIAGNFGVPFLDLLDAFLKDEIDYIVAEVSSFQGEYLAQSPHIAIFLSLFPEHMDRHGDMTQYLAAKANLWAHQQDEDFLIMPDSLDMFHSVEQLCPNKNRLILAPPLEATLFAEDSVFRAAHFLQNLGTIRTLGHILEIEGLEDIIARTAQDYIPPPHRLELIGEKLGMRFYNDSIATGPLATTKAVEFFGDQLAYLFLGGVGGGDTFETLVATLKAKAPEAKILITQSPILEDFKSEAEKAGLAFEVVSDFEAAMAVVVTHGGGWKEGQVCLLSPAAKSFDQYPNYPARGNHFRALVEAL